jgi:hypothetical protein
MPQLSNSYGSFEMSGMFGHLTEASHIAAGMDIPFGEALDLVKAAHEFAEQDEPTLAAIRTEGNVVYGVPFGL